MSVWPMKEPVNAWTHFCGLLASAAGMVLLIVMSRNQLPKPITMIIYGISLMLLYGASSVYHWVRTTIKKEVLLRKLDHVSIYLLIAGTYTPLLYLGLKGGWRWPMLGSVWGLALAGIVLKLFFINAPRSLSTALYVGLGWFALIPLYRLAQTLAPGAIILMLVGGAFYTVGAVIYATKCCDFFPKRFGFHEVFHLFVLAGSISHYLMVLLFLVPAGT